MMRRLLPAVFVAALCAISAPRLPAQVAGPSAAGPAAASDFPLSVENIMRGPEVVGVSPSSIRFTPDGQWILFRWQQGGVDTLPQHYRVAVAGGKPERLPRNAADTIPTADGRWSPDGQRVAVTLKGDVYLIDRLNRRARLTETRDGETGPHWSSDGRSVFYVRSSNLFGHELATGRVTQLTDFRRGEPPKKDEDPKGYQKFLKDQQAELFQFIRDEAEEKRLATQDTASTGAKPFYYSERQGIQGARASGDGRWVAFTLTERTRERRQASMPRWVTESGFTEPENIRTKVGDRDLPTKAGLLNVATGAVIWIRGGLHADSTDFEPIEFSPTSTHLLARGNALDYTRRVLITVTLDSAKRERIVDDLRDDAWVGPFSGPAGWLDANRIWFQSEKTGYGHLYVVGAEGGSATPWTSGKWEVQNVLQAPDRKTLFIRTNEPSPSSSTSGPLMWPVDLRPGPNSP